MTILQNEVARSDWKLIVTVVQPLSAAAFLAGNSEWYNWIFNCWAGDTIWDKFSVLLSTNQMRAFAGGSFIRWKYLKNCVINCLTWLHWVLKSKTKAPSTRIRFRLWNATFSLRIRLPSSRIQWKRSLKTHLVKNALQSGIFWKRRFCCLVPRCRSLVKFDALWVMGLIVRGSQGVVGLIQTKSPPSEQSFLAPPVSQPYRLLPQSAWWRGWWFYVSALHEAAGNILDCQTHV